VSQAAPRAAIDPGRGPFKSLVIDDSDLVGHVAYALYKRDKLKFCDSEKLRTGQPATQESIEHFIRGSSLDTRIESYRSEAERLLEQMTEYVLEDAIASVKREAEEELLRKLSEAKSWWRSITESLIGSVAVAIVWAVLVFVVSANRVGPEKVIGDVFDKDITDRQRPPAQAGQPTSPVGR
jgi:hypothetical protein